MPLVALAVLAYAAGLLAGFGGVAIWAAVAAAVAVPASLAARDARPAALALLVLAGALVAAGARAAERRCLTTLAGRGAWRVRLSTDALPGASARGVARGAGCTAPVRLSIDAGEAPPGSLVRATGEVAGRRGTLVIVHAAIVAESGPGLLVRLRTAAGRRLDDAFGADAPLARALLIADTHGLSPALRDRFAAAGMAHILSISGLHVGIIAVALELVFVALRLGRRRALLATVVVTAGYVLMIGAPPPALRSGAMLAVVAASRLLQRPTSPWAVLAVGAGVPLVDPATVLDLGWRLSVLGVAALICAGILARRVLAPRLDGWRLRLARDLLASVVASAASAPLIAWTFGRVSLVGPLANLVAAPIVAVLQPLLFLALALAPIPTAMHLAADAARPLLAALSGVAGWSASIPGAWCIVAPTAVEAVLAGVAAIALLAACARRYPGAPLCVGGAAVVLLVWSPLLPTATGRAELHVIDVGQGDAIALRTPAGRWVLFDAGGAWRGGDEGRAVVVPYLRRYGGALEAFVLSHPHTDHVGGAASVLRALHPRTYWDAAFAGASDAYRGSLLAASEEHVVWRRVHPGDTLRVDGVTVAFLAPDSAWTAGLADPNLASTIALVRYGAVRFLLVGDAERPEEEWLLARQAASLGVDVLKVGHHGSSTSTSPRFLAAVHPRLALVSVGAGNSYGHPSARVLRALAAQGAQVLRTDRVGSIVVRTDGHAIEVEADGDRWDLSPPSGGH